MKIPLLGTTSLLRSIFPVEAKTVIATDFYKQIKYAMLKLLYDSDVGEDYQYNQVWKAIILANSLESLWYLRCNLYSILARRLGESDAKHALSKITLLFHGRVSASQSAVPKIAQH